MAGDAVPLAARLPPGKPKAGKRILLAIGALAAVLALAAWVAGYFVDIDAYKPRAEAAASAALGMDVTVEGPLRVDLLRGLHVALGKVRVRNGGSEIAFVEEADVAIDLLPLLRRQLHYGSVRLHRARITLERGKDGRYNFQKPPGEAAPFHAFDLRKLSFPDLAIAYADRANGDAIESTGCKGELADMRHPGGAPFLMRLSLKGRVTCDELHGKRPLATDLALSLAVTDGVYEVGPVTMRAFGGEGSGTLRMDRSAEVPELHLDLSLARFRIGDFLTGLPPGKSVSGLMDFSTTLALRGQTRVELRRTATGTMSLSGTDLTLAGTDLDKRLARFESSQNFNLFDAGAVLLAGPLGLVVTKGYEFTSLAQETGGDTPIRTVVSRWKVDKGVARATDVALATREHRLALTGGLDFVDEEFDEVFVALIDADGCSRARQRIRGPFGKPVVEKPDLATSAAGPVLNLIEKARSLLPGVKIACEVVYRGSVEPPR